MARVDRGQILDLLSFLAAKSFVTYEAGGPPGGRSSILETVRQYGLQSLDGCGKTQTMRGRHLDAERGNLRATLGWGLQPAPHDGTCSAQQVR